jgi:transcription-repair coupling factor (superfamily II helicase)
MSPVFNTTGGKPVELAGLPLSAMAWRLSEARREDPSRPWAVVCPDRGCAEALHRALAFFTGEDAETLPLVVEPHRVAYSALNPEFAWERETATSLSRLAEGLPWSFLLLTAVTCVRKVPRPAAFRRHALLLEEGMEISRERIASFLESAGYGEADAVEEKGAYSIRGGLVEIFAPLYPDPIRLDLFGDTLESMHFFDPGTLARKRRVDIVELTPVSLLLMDLDVRERGLDRLIRMGDDAGLPSERLEEIRTALALDGRPPGYLNYLSVFHPSLEPISAFVPATARWAVVDQAAVEEVLSGFDLGVAGWYADWRSRGELGAAPEELFVSGQDLLERMLPRDAWRFSRLSTDPTRFDARPAGVKDLSELRTAITTARKARKPEFPALVEFVREVLFNRRGKVGLAAESPARARQIKKVMNLEGLKCELATAAALGRPLEGFATVRPGAFGEGFLDEVGRVAWIGEQDLFEARPLTLAREQTPWEKIHHALAGFQAGDLVVHDAYGIGRYRGVVRKRVDGVEADFLDLAYRDDDRVLLPVQAIARLQKYVAGEGAQALDKLGSNAFERRKERVRKALERIAGDLVDLYAARKLSAGDGYPAPDADFATFEEGFPFELTDDQRKALEEILADLQAPSPMDRLLCGDVGFGKTELAMRAAFMVAASGRQVAVLVPTTVLAEQHRQNIEMRLEPFGVRVDALTRFRTKKEQAQTIKDAAAGRVEVLVGTHRLLQGDVKLPDLGLLIIDEEHRFGVRDKDRIKQLRANVDVLSLTATPIPRSLELSLNGIRDLSVITTAPIGRQAVRTTVTRFNAHLVREAILRELNRGGKVFFVHSRVKNIDKIANFLNRLVPEARVVIGHGQMTSDQLEDAMVAFVKGDADILLCTTIVEAGLDIPTANTIIINEAHRFGLSELHQLRGRVGRSAAQAYAILLIPGERLLTPDARKRLRSIQRHADLGAGFQLAMEDLEIRGAGNLLGEAQSGHVEAVGYAVYMSLLEEAIAKRRGQAVHEPVDTTVKLPLQALLPEEWFPDEAHRTALYQRLARCRGLDEADALEEELKRHNDELPPPVANLLEVARIRVDARPLGVTEVLVRGDQLVVRFAADREEEWTRAMAAVAAGSLPYFPTGEREVRKKLPVMKPESLAAGVRNALLPLWACVRSEATSDGGDA